MPEAELKTLTGDYVIDPAHSSLGFSARHAMVATVHGHFGVFDGKIHLDEDHPENSTAVVEIDAASITTGNNDRDTHLRSADFLDVAEYPKLTYHSTGASKIDDESYRLHGELTIRDVTRLVELDITYQGSTVDPWGGFRVGFEGTTTINRKDWGLTWNLALEAGGILVSDKVKLVLDVAAVKQTEGEPAFG